MARGRIPNFSPLSPNAFDVEYTGRRPIAYDSPSKKPTFKLPDFSGGGPVGFSKAAQLPGLGEITLANTSPDYGEISRVADAANDLLKTDFLTTAMDLYSNQKSMNYAYEQREIALKALDARQQEAENQANKGLLGAAVGAVASVGLTPVLGPAAPFVGQGLGLAASSLA